VGQVEMADKKYLKIGVSTFYRLESSFSYRGGCH
jgi:hypothetical protein